MSGHDSDIAIPSRFSPEAVVAEFAELLKRYRISTIRGDRYAGMWPRERFAVHGINYLVSDKSRSEIYTDILPELNSKSVALLDNPRLVAQLSSLERRTSRGGKDIVDHPPNQHDDLANAVAGAVIFSRPAPNEAFSWSAPHWYSMPRTVRGWPSGAAGPSSTENPACVSGFRN